MSAEEQRQPSIREMEWPAPAHIIRETTDGRAFVDATKQIELVNETFGSEGWKTEIASPAQIVNDEFYSTSTKEMRAVSATVGARVTVRTDRGEIVRESVGSSTAWAERGESNGISTIDQALKSAWTNARKRAFSDIGKRFGSGVAKHTRAQLASAAREASVQAMRAADRVLPKLEEAYAKALAEEDRERAKGIGAEIGEEVRNAARVDPESSAQWREDWRKRLESRRREALGAK